MRAVEDYEYFHANGNYGTVTLVDCLDSFTHNLVQAFLLLGASVEVYRTGFAGDINVGDYLVLSPGPGHPSDQISVLDLLETAYGKIPIMGVCLGMQILALKFGGNVVRAPAVVHGKTSLITHTGTGIFHGCSNPTPVARYHSLMVESVPSEFEIQSIHDGIPMAFRSEYACAVQFHPESFLTKDGMTMLRNFLEGRR